MGGGAAATPAETNHIKFDLPAGTVLPDTPKVVLSESSLKKASVGITALYKVRFRKQTTNEFRQGVIAIRAGRLNGVIATFNKHGWGLLGIKKIKGDS